MHTKVIAISGHAGHGKDTVATMIQERLQMDGHKVVITHYADLLKYICTNFFGWNGKKDEKGRSMLQYVGTDIVRSKEPNFWVDFVVDILTYFDGVWEYAIIPDTRFPNEFNRLKERGLDAVHLMVVRPDFISMLTPEQQAHPSETALDNTKPDYYVENNGDLNALRDKITEWIRGGLYGEKR